MTITPTLLLILDGWGMAPPGPGNAVSQANTPHLDQLCREYPCTSLTCSGKDVGLPEGQMGNSEVGHMNIGAGRVVYQDIMRINFSIEDKSFFSNETFLDLISKTRNADGSVHLIGLVSPGGVHSHQSHLHALLSLCKQRNLNKVYVHVILDGRDTPPTSGKEYVEELMDFMTKNSIGTIATVSGRYYAMDRDKRWDRTRRAYDAMVHGQGRKAHDPLEAIQSAYDAGENDEFVKPVVIVKKDAPVATIRSGDGVIFFNFRADRARQLTQALYDPDFDKFERGDVPELSKFVTMTRYDADFPLPVAFPREQLENILGEVVSSSGLRQLRIAETEKYAHVTYFFNGGEEKKFPGEDRKLIPSPRNVSTYDEKPEMSVYEVTEVLCQLIRERTYDLMVCNFANMDMVGHTGIMEAAIKACEAVDDCVGKTVDAVLEVNGRVLLTADHGNADEMKDPGGKPHTAHSTNKVPFLWIEKNSHGKSLKEGKIGDIAPTLLALWKIEQPEEMTGICLLNKNEGTNE